MLAARAELKNSINPSSTTRIVAEKGNQKKLRSSLFCILCVFHQKPEKLGHDESTGPTMEFLRKREEGSKSIQSWCEMPSYHHRRVKLHRLNGIDERATSSEETKVLVFWSFGLCVLQRLEVKTKNNAKVKCNRSSRTRLFNVTKLNSKCLVRRKTVQYRVCELSNEETTGMKRTDRTANKRSSVSNL